MAHITLLAAARGRPGPGAQSKQGERTALDQGPAPPTWLIADADRERMLDMNRRVKPVREMSFVVIGLALVLSGPWLGWWPILLFAIAGTLFSLADRRAERGGARPEYMLFAAWTGSETMIAAMAAITGGPRSPVMAWFAIPIVTLSSRFSARGVATGVAVTLALMLAVTFGVNANAVVHTPPLLIMPIAVMIAVAILSTALMRSEVQHRNEAIIDQLTGMLNRNALSARAAELAQQSTHNDRPIGLIIGDIDHFKAINDSHGHASGDVVLKDVAHLLSDQLRAFDGVYRIGGEEFLVLMPGAGLEQTAAMATRLREAVAAGTVGNGLRVTMSFGVSASPGGRAFDYDAISAEADAALYEAKRSGRDAVRCASAPAWPTVEA
ncbi:MAG TPA: diguanylate cyclase [Solirubrobacteraceae bacterium]|nr:diguanylate cyclase [Solirubrobacteraceae bacterium]